MASPLPGMDPYLEGHLWPDVHAALASAIRQELVPLVRPRYAVRLGVYVAKDTTPEAEVGILCPDVEVLVRQSGSPRGEGEPPASGSVAARGRPAPLLIPVVEPAAYELSIDYQVPPPPALNDQELQWVAGRLGWRA